MMWETSRNRLPTMTVATATTTATARSVTSDVDQISYCSYGPALFNIVYPFYRATTPSAICLTSKPTSDALGLFRCRSNILKYTSESCRISERILL